MCTHQATTTAQLDAAGTGIALAPTTALPATFPGKPSASAPAHA